MDSDLTFEKHLKMVTKPAYYHLKNMLRVKKLMSQQDLTKPVHAFVRSSLDYCILYIVSLLV